MKQEQETETPFSDKVPQLIAMGFTDRTLIREALHFWSGDIKLAVNYIMNRKNRKK